MTEYRADGLLYRNLSGLLADPWPDEQVVHVYPDIEGEADYTTDVGALRAKLRNAAAPRTQWHAVALDAGAGGDFDIEVTTSHGVFNLRGSISDKDGALVLFIDTEAEPTPDVLRLSVNDGPVFNYDDAVNWYGDGQGIEAPTLADDESEETRCRWCGQEIGIIHYGNGDRWQPTPALGDDLCEVRAELATDEGIYRHEPEA